MKLDFSGSLWSHEMLEKIDEILENTEDGRIRYACLDIQFRVKKLRDRQTETGRLSDSDVMSLRKFADKITGIMGRRIKADGFY